MSSIGITAGYTATTAAAVTVLMALNNKWHWGFTAEDMGGFVALAATAGHTVSTWAVAWWNHQPIVQASPAPDSEPPPPTPASAGQPKEKASDAP